MDKNVLIFARFCDGTKFGFKGISFGKNNIFIIRVHSFANCIKIVKNPAKK